MATRYRGVTTIKAAIAAPYNAVVVAQGRTYSVGLWPTARQAALARDRVVLHLGLDYPLNYAERARSLGPASPEEMKQAARELTNQRRLERASMEGRCIGVKRLQSGGFGARIGLPGARHIGLGVWPTEREAALARDRAVLHCGFPFAAESAPDGGAPGTRLPGVAA